MKWSEEFFGDLAQLYPPPAMSTWTLSSAWVWVKGVFAPISGIDAQAKIFTIRNCIFAHDFWGLGQNYQNI